MGLTECPICGDACTKVNNHVHMASGDGHGEQHSYPEGYDKDTLTVGGSGESDEHDESGDGSGGNIATTGDGDSGDSDGLEAHGEARPLDIADQATESRTYHCSECGAPVGYLADFCDECDSSLVWGGVDADDGDDGEHVEHDDDGETADMGADE